MKPLSDATMDSLYENLVEIKDGRRVTKLKENFPLKWKWKHFKEKPKFTQ